MIIAVLGATVAQSRQQPTDSARLVVNRYLDILNYDALRSDSIFYVETIIYKRSQPDDTAILKRWFLPPNLFRAELWHGDTLLEGCFSNCRDIFREYKLGMLDGWTRVSPSRYYDIMPKYDFRGPLHNWETNGNELRYDGIWDYQGHDVYRIYVESVNKYNRYFLFEKESGLLFFIEETKKHSDFSNHQAFSHPDWHGFHEYQPIGPVILPSIESYQMDGDVIFYYSNFRYLPKRVEVFTTE